MNKAGMRAIVEAYRRRLMLLHWHVDIDFDAEVGGDSHAEIAWSWNYDRATISLSDDWRTWDECFAQQVVAHEFVHVVCRDLQVCALETIDRLPKAAAGVARERWHHALEGVTERLAWVLTGAQP